MTPPNPALDRRAPAELPLPNANPALAHLEAQLATLELGPEAAAVPLRLWNAALYDPARAFLAEPGKGFRARLVELSWQLGGGAAGGCPPELAVALEWLHAGSLIVDDIEDGSLVRRGQPALHVSHGLGRALNTGNFLYFAAQAHLDRADLPPATRSALQAAVVAALVRCHHGQALDIAAHVEQLAQAEVAGVVRATTALKTGALTALAANLGAQAAGATGAQLAAIVRFGGDLGAGLQMLDDLGSVLAARRHDKALEDLRGGHPTWLWAWLAETADPFTFVRLQAALRAVRTGGPAEPLLAELHERLTHVGRARVAAHLERALVALREAVVPSPAVAAVEAELERLRRSYV